MLGTVLVISGALAISLIGSHVANLGVPGGRAWNHVRPGPLCIDVPLQHETLPFPEQAKTEHADPHAEQADRRGHVTRPIVAAL